MASVEDKLRCPFCLEEIIYLDNPKQLDCSHIYCQPCLLSHVKTTESGSVFVSCVLCSQECEVDGLDCLLTVPSSSIKSSSSSAKSSGDGEPDRKRAKRHTSTSKSASRIDDKYRCTPCGEKRVKSVCYCASCDKQLCENHEQMHNEVFSGDEKHQTMDIKQYMEKPKLYVKPLCQNHQKELSMCCIDCYSMKCAACPINKDCRKKGKKTKGDNPVNPNKPHNFLSLQEAGTQIKAQFASICKEVAGKITEMCKAEKDAWHKLDQLEDECETMYKQVETKTEVLIKLVKDFASSTKKRIRTYEQHARQEVERSLQMLRSDREVAENMQAVNGDALNYMHASEIVRRRRGLHYLFLTELSEYSVFDDFPEMRLVKELFDGFMAVEGTLKVDHKLSFVTDVSLPTESRCNMVTRSIGHEQPLILCACKEGIIFQTASDLMAEKWRCMATDGEGAVVSVLCWKKDLYYIETDGRDGKEHVFYIKCVKNFRDFAANLKEDHEESEELLEMKIRDMDDCVAARMSINPDIEKLEIDIGTRRVSLDLSNEEAEAVASHNKSEVYDVGTTLTKGHLLINRKGLDFSGALLDVEPPHIKPLPGARAIATDNDDYFLIACNPIAEDEEEQEPAISSRIHAISWKDGKELRCLEHEMLELCDPTEGICMFGRDVYMLSKDGVRLMKFLLPEIVV